MLPHQLRPTRESLGIPLRLLASESRISPLTIERIEDGTTVNPPDSTWNSIIGGIFRLTIERIENRSPTKPEGFVWDLVVQTLADLGPAPALSTCEATGCGEIAEWPFGSPVICDRHRRLHRPPSGKHPKQTRAERNAAIVEMRRDGETYRSIAEMYGISPPAVRTIILKHTSGRGADTPVHRNAD